MPKPKDGGKISLGFLLIIPFVIQIVGAVAVTAYISLRSSEDTVGEMVDQLQTETGNRVDAYVRSNTNLPHQFLRTTRASIDAGILDPNDFRSWERYLWHQAPLNESAQLIYFANQQNEFIGIERPINDGSRDRMARRRAQQGQAATPQAPGAQIMALIDGIGQGNTWYEAAPSLNDQMSERLSSRNLIPSTLPPSPLPFESLPALPADIPGILWEQSPVTNQQLHLTKIWAPNRPGTRLQTLNNFRPTERPWYRQASHSREPTWSPIYKDLLRPRLVISAIHPLFDASQSLMGVLAIDFNLTELSKFLVRLNLSERGEAFIVERSGNLVASSDVTQPVFVPDGDTQRRFNAFDSKNQAIQWSLIRLKQKYKSLRELHRLEQPVRLKINLGRDNLFVYVNSLENAQGLNWLLVVAEYESDFTKALKLSTRNTMLLAAIALLVATLISILTARLIARPILELSQASNAISDGALSQSVKSSSSIKELEALAHSFNQMSSRMKDAFAELEVRVQLRTFELWEAKESADRAKESATAANRSKSEFLANMSHELRTPLNGILGYAQILQKDVSLSPRQHQAINTIAQCGNHLLSLINDVLDLAKIEARRMDIEPSCFSLERLLNSVIELFQMRTIQKGLTFEAHLDEHLPEGVISDPKRIRQVLINLLGNAVKFTESGQITLSVSVVSPFSVDAEDTLTLADSDPASAQTIRFAVEDTGIGMDKGTLAKVFLPFEQGGGIDQRSQGTGLGLSISQQIVELLGSRIYATSQAGKGSKFWFDLPLLTSPIERGVDDTSHWGDILGYQGESFKILIADHRLENRAILTELLEPLGFLIQEASQLEGLVDVVSDEPPDLIILDLDWPEYDDYDDAHENLARLSHSPELQGIPLLVSSASVFERDRSLSLKAGANDFLTKPIQVDQLYSQLTKHLKLHWVYTDDPQAPKTRRPQLSPITGAHTHPSYRVFIPPHSASSAPPPPSSTVPAPPTTPDPISPPGSDDLDILFRLAMQGNINQIKNHANKLAEQEPGLEAFALEINKLANTFQVKKIRALIDHHRTEEQ